MHAGCTAIALSISYPSYAAWTQAGWEWRFSPEIRELLHHTQKIQLGGERTKVTRVQCHLTSGLDWNVYLDRLTDCNAFKAQSIVILGDSLAADLYAAISQNSKVNLIQYTGGGCTPAAAAACRRLMDHAANDIIANKDNISAVFYTQFMSERSMGKSLELTVSFLETLTSHGIDVVWLGPQMTYDPDIPTILSRSRDLKDFLSRASRPAIAIHHTL